MVYMGDMTNRGHLDQIRYKLPEIMTQTGNGHRRDPRPSTPDIFRTHDGTIDVLLGRPVISRHGLNPTTLIAVCHNLGRGGGPWCVCKISTKTLILLLLVAFFVEVAQNCTGRGPTNTRCAELGIIPKILSQSSQQSNPESLWAEV